jgi:PAS domain S-box-containing protein
MEKRIIEEQVYQRGFSDEYEKENIHKNGKIFPVALRVWLKKDFTGKPIGMWAIVRDITEQKRTREELERNRARLQAIFDNASVGLMVVDKDGRYLEVNERSVELLGYTAEELRQMTNRELTYPEDVPESIQYLNRLVQGEIDRYQIEKRYVRKDGSIFWALLSVTPIRKADGEFQSAIGVVVDLSERKAYEQALRESEDRFRQLAENARDLIYRYRFVPNQGFEYVSPSATAITGYTPEEHYADPLLGLKLSTRGFAFTGAGTQGSCSICKADILRWMRKDGSIIWTEQQNVPIYDSEQRVVALEGVARDITDRKKAEMELLEARGQLAQQVKELERYSHELSLANAMLIKLQTCEQLDEAYSVIEEYARKLFPHLHGQLWIFDEDKGCLFIKACFGSMSCVAQSLCIEDCLALQQKSTYLVKDIHDTPLCTHLESPIERLSGYLCVPIVIDDRLIGLFHVALKKDISSSDEHWELAETTAKQIGLALTNINLRNQLRQQAIHDNLTGLFNRLYMEEILNHEVLRAMRTGQPISMMMLDIDHFKHFNDTYGHLAGDEVLRALATTLIHHIRAGDVACRYGGEEFLLILLRSTLRQRLFEQKN